MITIEFWSDFMCPFCYIGEKRIKDVVKAMSIEDKVNYKMKAFELDPTSSNQPKDKAIPLMAQRHQMPLEDAERRAQYIEKLAREVGLDFHYADMQFVNSLQAHELVKYAQTLNQSAQVDRLVDALFKAVFVEGKNIADTDVLLQIATDCGFNDTEKVTQAITTKTYEPIVRQEEMELGRLGVNSVPLFIIGNKGISDVPSTEGIKELLQEAMVSEKIEVIKEDEHNDDMTGMSCGIHGCKI